MGDMSGLYLCVTIVTSAVGSGMVIYGIRQKEPLPLVFGLVLGLIPMFITSGWGVLVLSIITGGVFYGVRKYL